MLSELGREKLVYCVGQEGFLETSAREGGFSIQSDQVRDNPSLLTHVFSI